MPARDRTDAVDWSAVEAWLVGSQVIADLGERMGGDPAPAELSHALAAVRLVRALEERRIVEVECYAEEHPSVGFKWYVYTNDKNESHYCAPTLLEAVTRALDASKGEG